MSSPWLKFYPSDWRADPALRMCSVGARGLWMEMLCVMHEATPRGSLRVNGNPLSERQLASLSGAAVDEVSALLSELELSGVFSRDADGVVFSRRMMRDDAKAQEDKANGKMGGNPTLKGGVNPPQKGEDKAQKPEARNQKEEAGASSKRASEPSEFEEWYRHYPHKVQRGSAEKAFASARKIASLEDLIAGTLRYVATKPADYAWRNPATWLNGKGWLDQPGSAPQPSPRAGAPPAIAPRNPGERAILKLEAAQNEPPNYSNGRVVESVGSGQARSAWNDEWASISESSLGKISGSR